MATLTSKLIVQLLDYVTGPSKRVAAALNALTAASARNSARLSAISGKLIGTGAAAFGLVKGLAAPIKAGAEFQSMLEDIRQKSGMAAPELKSLGLSLRGIAAATNQLPSDTIKTFDSLLGLGLGGKTDAENIDAALKMLPAINKVAAAYRASSNDVMAAGQAVFANLKVPADQVINAFDSMAKSGKEGAFEHKDMAKYFPELTSVLGTLGVRGVKASQISVRPYRFAAARDSTAVTEAVELAASVTEGQAKDTRGAAMMAAFIAYAYAAEQDPCPRVDG